MSTDRLAELFWSKVQILEPDECWPWLAGESVNGYGKYRYAGRFGLSTKANRLAYQLTHPDVDIGGLMIRHKCDNKLCCNPSHLVPGTALDNAQDRNSRNRQARGEKQGKSKLTEAQVRQIIGSDRTQHSLALEHGVSQMQISNIKAGRSWAHIRA